MMVLVKLLAALVAVLFNATANSVPHQIPYSIGATTPVCVLPIDYTNCSDPAIKLNYHPSTSSSSVGILVYNKVYMPDRLVARNLENATVYGFVNVTSKRNDSFLSLYFMEMSVPANGLTFSLDQICGVTKLNLEKEYCFKFILVSSTYPSPATSGNTTSSGLPTNTSTPTNSSQKPEENERHNNKISSGEIAGIIIAVIVFLIILAIIIFYVYKHFCP